MNLLDSVTRDMSDIFASLGCYVA